MEIDSTRALLIELRPVFLEKCSGTADISHAITLFQCIHQVYYAVAMVLAIRLATGIEEWLQHSYARARLITETQLRQV